MTHPNLELLEIACAKLDPLLPELVFVGGCATGLLVTDKGAAPCKNDLRCRRHRGNYLRCGLPHLL